MEVRWNDKDYTFNLERIRVSEAKIIKVQTGYTLMTLEEGLDNADPDALRAVFWLMMVHNGEPVALERVDFEILAFAKALQEGSEKEAEAAKAEKEAAEANGDKVEAPKDPA